MNIAKRLALLIAIAMVCLLGVGSISLIQMGQINNKLTDVTGKAMPSISIIDQAAIDFYELGLMAQSHALTKQVTEKASYDKHIQELKIKLSEGLAQYQKMISDDKDKAMLEADQQSINAYLKALEPALANSRDNMNEEAAAVLTSIRPLQQTAIDALNAHSVYNENSADAASKAAASAYSSSFWIVSVVVALALLVTGGLGWLLYRAMIGSIQSMRTVIEQIALSLDFTRRVPVLRRDEIGLTVEAFNGLINRLQESFRQIAERTAAVSDSASRMANTSPGRWPVR